MNYIKELSICKQDIKKLNKNKKDINYFVEIVVVGNLIKNKIKFRNKFIEMYNDNYYSIDKNTAQYYSYVKTIKYKNL